MRCYVSFFFDSVDMQRRTSHRPYLGSEAYDSAGPKKYFMILELFDSC